jgi:hypothetical protein
MLRVASGAEMLVLSAAASFTTREERERGRPSVLPQLRDPKPRYRPDLQQVQLSTEGGRRAEVQRHDDDESAPPSAPSRTRSAGPRGAAPAAGGSPRRSPSFRSRSHARFEVEGHDGGRGVSAPRHPWRPGVAAGASARRVAARCVRRAAACSLPIRSASRGDSRSTAIRNAAVSSVRVWNGGRPIPVRSYGHGFERADGHAAGRGCGG